MAQKAIDDNQGSMVKTGIRCPVCQECVPENLGRHMRVHGDKVFQEYMSEQRAATPSEYRTCVQCQKTFHRRSWASHLSKVHAGDHEPRSEVDSRSTKTPGQRGRAGSEQAEARTVGVSSGSHHGNMGPPPSKIKTKKTGEHRERTCPVEMTAETRTYSVGRIQEAVRRMINHRGTDTYTREKVKEICREEMPGLLDSEYDLATDFTIATAREVAAVSQYAAAHRTMNASEKYKDANEQIATLVRGPKIEPMKLPPSSLARPTPVFGASEGTDSRFRPIPSGMQFNQLRDSAGANKRTSTTNRPRSSEVGMSEMPTTPLSQFIRSLRSPLSPLSQAAQASPQYFGSTTESEGPIELSGSDSDAIPPSQAARARPRTKQTKRKTSRHDSEDEEVRALTSKDASSEGLLNQNRMSESDGGDEDGQEFSQTY